MKKSLILGLSALIVGCGDSSSTVQEMVSPIDKSLTMGQILEGRSACSNSGWDSKTDDMGREFIYYYCDMEEIGSYFKDKADKKRASAESEFASASERLDESIKGRKSDIERQKEKVARIEAKLSNPEQHYKPPQRYRFDQKIAESENILSVLSQTDPLAFDFYDQTSSIKDSSHLASDFRTLRWQLYQANKSSKQAIERGIEREIRSTERYASGIQDEMNLAYSESLSKVRETLSKLKSDRQADFEDYVQSLEDSKESIQKTIASIQDAIANTEEKRPEIVASAQERLDKVLQYVNKWGNIDFAEETIFWYIDQETGLPEYSGSLLTVYSDDEVVDERDLRHRSSLNTRLKLALENRKTENYSEYHQKGRSWYGNIFK